MVRPREMLLHRCDVYAPYRTGLRLLASLLSLASCLCWPRHFWLAQSRGKCRLMLFSLPLSLYLPFREVHVPRCTMASSEVGLPTSRSHSPCRRGHLSLAYCLERHPHCHQSRFLPQDHFGPQPSIVDSVKRKKMAFTSQTVAERLVHTQQARCCFLLFFFPYGTLNTGYRQPLQFLLLASQANCDPRHTT